MNESKDREVSAAMTPAEKAVIVARFERHINRGQVKYLKSGHLDVIETQRLGIGFVDPLSGREMIDCFSSAGCFNVGRHNPEVMQTLDEALDTLDMGNYDLPSEDKIAYAKRLTELAPGDLNKILFASGGGDAVEAAIKLARGATGKKQILSTVKAYHGHTGFALSANGKEHYRGYCEPLMPGFDFVPFNDLEAMRQAASDDLAAIIVEPVQGEAGIFLGDSEYLQGLRNLCDARGAVLIFDEIQTGFGRTGRMFALEHSGVVPDILTLAKSLGGGLFPNAAMLYRDIDLLTAYVEAHPDFHPSYTGGSDLGARVSTKVIDYIEAHDLCGNAERRGARLKEALQQLMADNPKIIKEVRGIGLMVGLEYIHEFMGPMMSDALAKHGVFAAYSGNAPQVMRFMAPITIDENELERLIEAIGLAVKDMKILLPLALPAARIPPVLRLLNNEKVQTTLFGFIRKLEDAAGAVSGIFKRS